MIGLLMPAGSAISALQFHAVRLACARHEQKLPDGSRAGFFLGDGEAMAVMLTQSSASLAGRPCRLTDTWQIVIPRILLIIFMVGQFLGELQQGLQQG
jgi:hypothetical protein